MKTIILFRHGKSDWNADYGRDHERPLAPRGVKAAGAMGKWLQATGQIPDHHVSSSAVRARTTLKLAKEAGNWGGETHIVDALYEASVADYVDVARQTPASANSVIITGHEPTCSGTTRVLSGGAIVRFPTATMARIDVDIESWQDLGRYPGQLIWFMPPKFLG